MTREEYINKILELSKEIMILSEPTIDDLKKLYLQTKVSYEIMKEATKVFKEGENNEFKKSN